MPLKEDVINELDKTNYTKLEVVLLLQSVQSKPLAPKSLKKGDMYIDNIGSKKRPAVIVKVLPDIVISIALSTTEDAINLCPYPADRFREPGFFSKGFMIATIDHARNNYAGQYEDKKLLNEVIKLAKNFINNSL
jgi:hypothetical protein